MAAAAAAPLPPSHMHTPTTHNTPRRRKPLPSSSSWLDNLLATLPSLLSCHDPSLQSISSQSSTRAALLLIRAAYASGGEAKNALLQAAKSEHAVTTMLQLLKPPDSVQIHVATLVATQVLCSDESFRDAFVANHGVFVICDLISPTLQQEQQSQDQTTLWNAGIRTLSKLMVCSVAACAISIQSGTLQLLAHAARPNQPIDVRLRAAAGLAAIAAWSGPRKAMEIVETDHVVSSMMAILSEKDERIPNDLRSATIDGLVVMSHRRHVRRVLQTHNAEEKIKAAARLASVSGDYAAAARSTVAAGQLTGRSVDEYGFLVEEQQANGRNDSLMTEEGIEIQGVGAINGTPTRLHTGLRHIQKQLLEEPYTAVEDLDVLQEIVHEDAGVLSSSPRDRKYVRKAARTYGVSADEIEFLPLLEETTTPNGKAKDGQTETSPGSSNRSIELAAVDDDEAVVASDGKDVISRPINGEVESAAEIAETGNSAMQTSFHSLSRPVAALASVPTVVTTPRQLSMSSARPSSSLVPGDDPDFDRSAREIDMDVASDASSINSKTVSPLVMFSSATKRAAERDGKNNLLQKTVSQLNRETEHERFWREVIEDQPEKLRRERGRSSRVVAYRELATVPVPSSMRRRLWPVLLDTESLREAKPGLYGTLCRGTDYPALPDDIEHTIEADVTRTMPLHSLFWAGGAQVGVQSLRSILQAYARYVPDVGYCQGMSSIAAVFMMNADDEEEAFLMMAQFMSRFQYKKVFAPGFPLMLQWISELKPLVEHYMPELNGHFERENVSLELYADKWLITALSHNFPHRYLLRVWDLMFLGGSPKIILKACLAVLKQCESRLMTMDFEKMMPFLQRGFADTESGVLTSKNPEPFIALMREYRFLPGEKKGQAKESARRKSSNSQSNRGQRREGRSGGGGSCLPCFRRSATVD